MSSGLSISGGLNIQALTSGSFLSNPGSILDVGSISGGLDIGDALTGAQGRADPQLAFLWYAQMPVIGSAAGSSVFGTDLASDGGLASLAADLLGSSTLASVFGSGSQYLSFATGSLPWTYVEAASLVFRQYDATEIFRDGRKKKYVNHYTIQDLTLHLYADENNVALNYLQAWNSSIQAPFTANQATLGGGFGRAANYKKPIIINFLDINNNQLTSIEYIGCWPKEIGSVDMTSAGDQRVVYQVPFSVDDVFINTINVTI